MNDPLKVLRFEVHRQTSISVPGDTLEVPLQACVNHMRDLAIKNGWKLVAFSVDHAFVPSIPELVPAFWSVIAVGTFEETIK